MQFQQQHNTDIQPRKDNPKMDFQDMNTNPNNNEQSKKQKQKQYNYKDQN